MKILLLVMLVVNLYAINIKLSDVAYFASKQTHKTVILSKDMEADLIVQLGDNNPDYFKFLKSYAKSNGYKLIDRSNVISFSSLTDLQVNVQHSNDQFMPPPPPLTNDSYSHTSNSIGLTHNGQLIQSIPLQGGTDSNTSSNTISDACKLFNTYDMKYVSTDDIESVMSLYSVKYKVLPNTNKLVYCDDLNLSINDLLESIDKPADQVEVKITVASLKNSKLKDVGISPHLDFDFSMLSQKGSLFTSEYSAKFYGSLSFLQNKGVSDIISSTTYMLTNRRSLTFSDVTTLAYLDSDYSTIQNSTNPSTITKKYQFKDVGYTIDLSPIIHGEEVDLNLDLKVEDIISNDQQLPITAGKKLNTRFRANKGDIILLAGINRKSMVKSTDDMPLPFYVPLISDLLTHTKDTDDDTSLMISIEIIKK